MSYPFRGVKSTLEHEVDNSKNQNSIIRRTSQTNVSLTPEIFSRPLKQLIKKRANAPNQLLLNTGHIMCESAISRSSEISFRRISALTVEDIYDLSETLSDQQRGMVADIGTSIAEAHLSENAWFRTIYADETLISFIMLHIGSDHDDGIDCPCVFLWRFMIATPFQGVGLGHQAIKLLKRDLKIKDFSEIFTCYSIGKDSP